MAVLNTDLTYTACPPIRYRELDLGCSFYKSSVLTFSFCSAEAFFMLGCYYYHSELGLQQDLSKAIVQKQCNSSSVATKISCS